MPSSNQQTDTNNNSNNKIINGRSEPSDGVVVVLPAMAPTAAVVGATLLLPGGQAALVASPGSPQAANNNNISVAGQATAMTQPSSLISAIKQHSDTSLPLNNNNNNITNGNHTNNNNNNHILNNNHVNNNNNNNSINTPSRPANQTRQPQVTSQQPSSSRGVEELTKMIKDVNFDRTSLSNEELIRLVKNNQISIYKLENFLGKDNAARCVEIRRDYYRLELAELDKIDQLGIRDRSEALNNRRYEDLDYERVNGACCENVIGHVKVPVGLAGPLVLDGEEIFVPLATTEGCLVASTCRGLSALRKSGGVSSRVRRDFMTRAPIIRFQDTRLRDALDNVERAIVWLNDKCNKEKMRAAFNLTSSHGKFLTYTMHPVNREIHIRFEAQTGDAMGMNMCSKGVESALKEMQRAFPTMEIVTLSGNMCTDKKAAGINWINGRGKSVECNAELPAHVVQQVFKVSVDQLVDRWKSKVMIGSALAASIGGFNSQAANILTAIFIATGQDPAQNVTSSNCMLILEKDSKGSLVVCCTMPSIECGTVGGGTILGDQSRYLQMMGVKGPTPKLTRQQQLQHMNHHNQHHHQHANRQSSSVANQRSRQEASSLVAAADSTSIVATTDDNSNNNNLPIVNNTNEYTNARKLARIVCATVMAAELSLLAALTEGTLVKSHMRHNRSSTNVIANSLTLGIGGGPGVQASSCFGPLNSISSSSNMYMNNNNNNHHNNHKNHLSSQNNSNYGSQMSSYNNYNNIISNSCIYSCHSQNCHHSTIIEGIDVTDFDDNDDGDRRHDMGDDTEEGLLIDDGNEHNQRHHHNNHHHHLRNDPLHSPGAGRGGGGGPTGTGAIGAEPSARVVANGRLC